MSPDDDRPLTEAEIEAVMEENVRRGYAEVTTGPDGRKHYRLTQEGRAYVETQLLGMPAVRGVVKPDGGEG